MEIIICAAVSLIGQWFKQKLTSEWQVLGVSFVLSIAAAAGYWETVANVLIIAGAFYACIIQRFEAKKRPYRPLRRATMRQDERNPRKR